MRLLSQHQPCKLSACASHTAATTSSNLRACTSYTAATTSNSLSACTSYTAATTSNNLPACASYTTSSSSCRTHSDHVVPILTPHNICVVSHCNGTYTKQGLTTQQMPQSVPRSCNTLPANSPVPHQLPPVVPSTCLATVYANDDPPLGRMMCVRPTAQPQHQLLPVTSSSYRRSTGASCMQSVNDNLAACGFTRAAPTAACQLSDITQTSTCRPTGTTTHQAMSASSTPSHPSIFPQMTSQLDLEDITDVIIRDHAEFCR